MNFTISSFRFWKWDPAANLILYLTAWTEVLSAAQRQQDDFANNYLPSFPLSSAIFLSNWSSPCDRPLSLPPPSSSSTSPRCLAKPIKWASHRQSSRDYRCLLWSNPLKDWGWVLIWPCTLNLPPQPLHSFWQLYSNQNQQFWAHFPWRACSMAWHPDAKFHTYGLTPDPSEQLSGSW